MTGVAYNHADSWIVLNKIEQSIKNKIETIGKPLKDWNININYGIKTGLNDAFIISSEQKEKLIAADPKSAELIRPILRGRDIKRYGYEFSNLWLINTHNGIKDQHIPRIDINDYSAIKQYLDNFYDKLAKRADKGSTPYNLRNCAYMNDLNKQKIIWGEISDKPKFSIDENGQYFPEATTFLMTGNHLKYLLGFLNSTFSEYFFAKYGTTTGMGTLRWKKYLIELLPIPVVTPEKENEFVSLVDQVLISNGKDQMAIEQVDNAIYKLLNFDATEIDFIENMVKQGAH